MIDLELFRVLAPEYSSIQSDEVVSFSKQAESEVGDAFGPLYDRALCLLTAHLIFNSREVIPSTPGRLNSTTVGGVTKSWDNPFSTSGLSTSKYGFEFRRLSLLILRGPIFT